MAKEKNTTFIIVSIIFFITLLFLFVVFLEENYWWILPTIFYFAFFTFRESNLKLKETNNRLKIKDCREIRIDFWD